MPSLTGVYLHSNLLSEVGTVAFVKRAPAKLDILTLWHNRIGDKGLEALYDAIQSGKLRPKSLIAHTNPPATAWARERLNDLCKGEKIGVSC